MAKKVRKKVPARSKMSAYERLQWCRRQWMDNPDIPIQGKGGIISMMKSYFGVAASYDVLYKLRNGIKKELEDKKEMERENRSLRLETSMRLRDKEQRERAADLAGQIRDTKKKRLISNGIPTPDSPPVVSGVTATEMRKKKHKASRGSSFAEREIFALQQLRLRPHMPMGGPDGLREMIRSRFGVGMSHGPLKVLKDQIIAELNEPDTLKAIVSSMPKEKVAIKADDAESAIRTAAELIQESIPDLKEFLLTVDEEGKTHVSYKQFIVRSGELTI